VNDEKRSEEIGCAVVGLPGALFTGFNGLKARNKGND